MAFLNSGRQWNSRILIAEIIGLCPRERGTANAVYREACRLSNAHTKFVVVGMHPFFFMMGMPTHFKDTEGNPKAIETYIHLFSDHVRAAFKAGWTLVEVYEGVIDEEWIRAKPKWAPLKNYPVNFGYIWERNG